MSDHIRVKNAVVDVLNEYNANPTNVWEDGTVFDAVKNYELDPSMFKGLDEDGWADALYENPEVRKQCVQMIAEVVFMLNEASRNVEENKEV